MSTPQIWIDADACPAAVKEIVFRAAARLNLQVLLIANKPMHLPRQPGVSMVVVAHGLDAADDHIATHVQPGDIVITADVPLGSRIVEQGAVAITPRGRVMDESTIAEMRSIRDICDEFRAAGGHTGGPAPFDDKARRAFANAFDRILAKAIRR